jgi:hypothetical protein
MDGHTVIRRAKIAAAADKTYLHFTLTTHELIYMDPSNISVEKRNIKLVTLMAL